VLALFWFSQKILAMPKSDILATILLVGETTGGGFETLGGDKTHCFISTNK
jgi:hypothetical protein